MRTRQSTFGGFNIGGINASGQLPAMTGNFGLIDKDTPQSLYTKPSYADPSKEFQLVFSDEFNEDGRTFYPGDDPYWEAADLHYWQVNIISYPLFFSNEVAKALFIATSLFPRHLFRSGINISELRLTRIPPFRQTTWNGTILQPLQQKVVLSRSLYRRRRHTECSIKVD